MPQFPLFVAAALADVSCRALRKAIADERLEGHPVIAQEGHRKGRLEYRIPAPALFALYPTAEVRWKAHQAAKAVAARMAEEEAARAARRREVQAANPAKSDRGLAKAWHVQAFRAFQARSGHGKKRALSLYVADVLGRRLEVPDWVQAAHTALSERSLERWEKALEQGGAAALDPRYEGGRARTLDLVPDMGTFVLSLLTQNPSLRAKALHEALKTRFGQETPSCSTVARWVAAWKKEHAREWLLITNPDRYKSKYQIALGSRSEAVTRPNALWETDATKVDMIFSDDPRRWQLLGLVDVYTDRRLFLLVERGSGREHGRLLREAILRWGWPDALKTDNGKDYTGKYMTRLCADMGIQQVLCRPFSGDEKPHVERGFGVLQNDIVEMLPGFCGHSVAQAQDIRARRTFAERLFRRSKSTEDQVAVGVTRAEFQTFLDKWMTADLARPRSAKSHIKGRSPQQVLDAWIQKGEAPLRVCKDVHLLDYLLLPVLEKVITKKGIEHLGRFYKHELMGAHVGDRVEARLAPENLGHLSVFDPKGTFLFLAQCPELLGTSSQELAVAARIIQRRQAKETRAFQRSLKKVASLKNVADAVLDERLQGLDPVQSQAALEVVHTETMAQAAEAHAASLRAESERAKEPPVQRQLPITPEQERAARDFLTRERSEDPRERYIRLARQPLVSAADREWMDHFETTPEGRGLQKAFAQFSPTPKAQ